MTKRRIVITGAAGQDGGILAHTLLEKRDYELHLCDLPKGGMSNYKGYRIIESNKDYYERGFTMFGPGIILHEINLLDHKSLEKMMTIADPDEVYHFAAQIHVKKSFEDPILTTESNTLGTLKLLEIIKEMNTRKKVKFLNVSSAEIFGKVLETPQKETTHPNPQSPYGISKLSTYLLTKHYREAYELFACNAISFNHESVARDPTDEGIVTSKIVGTLIGIRFGMEQKLSLGNLDAKRDWGYAPEFIKAYQLMMQHHKPDDYVVGTGETHSVREFLEEVLRIVHLEIQSNGKTGLEEKYLDKKGKVLVEIDPKWYRPLEVDLLLADPSKIKRELGWEAKTKFKDLVQIMCDDYLSGLRKFSLHNTVG